ncbi:type II secretion system F family protein [Halocatena marina]|uniref:type II secretion system F family protein n=1 Tax=Halocatena marina TaxID=2934937 RepID=UPI00200CDA17|nr:type II secretion system F family protein [Halocatena marina]
MTSNPGLLDRGLYALFSRHAESTRHDQDRRYFRGTAFKMDFDFYLARIYGLSWGVFVLTVIVSATVVGTVPATGIPRSVLTSFEAWSLSRVYVALASGTLLGLIGKRLVLLGGRGYLKWIRTVRRENIEQTLPGAVRYLRTLAAGSDDQRTLLRKVAEQETYGETAVGFRRALNHAALTGNLDSGLRRVARDTPSEDLLAPFLLKFGEHASQGGDALSGYLRMESRMLSHRQARSRQRSSDFLELIAEMFVVLLVLPALLVIILTVMAVLSPSLSQTISTPVGSISLRSVLVYGSAIFVLWIGIGTSWLIGTLRPPDLVDPAYRRPEGILATLDSASINPISAGIVMTPITLVVVVVCAVAGYNIVNVLLIGYVTIGIPVGIVSTRRARRDDAKDHEMRDFVHAVAGHVSLGRPFDAAVTRVARDVDLGPLQPDVNALAFNLGLLTTADSDESDVRTAALDRFVDRVGTSLTEQTIGLVTGALDVGSDIDDVFETLQTEIGRLYHEKRALRSTMAVYVAVGWTTAVLIVGIMIAVNSYVIDSFTQLASVSGMNAGVAINPDAIQPERDRFQFYVVTQSTMLACGWFAGTARRGKYEALLHSALLVGAAYAVFSGTGMI